MSLDDLIEAIFKDLQKGLSLEESNARLKKVLNQNAQLKLYEAGVEAKKQFDASQALLKKLENAKNRRNGA